MHPTPLPWIPDPVSKDDDKSHYKPYSDVVNTNTSESRPSANVDKPKELAEKFRY